MSEPNKIRRLKKLQASEVSLVNRGAIRRTFLVVKNREGGPMADNTPAVVPALPAEHEAKFAALMQRAVRKAEGDADPAATADATADDALDERGMAALKAVYRILLPFKGQITEDMVDDVLAELDLDDTGDDGQTDDDNTSDDDDDTDDGVADDVASSPTTEKAKAMAKDFDPEDLKKAADWSPAKPDGASDDDHEKAMQAAKAAYAKAIGKAADDDDDKGDDDDDDVKKSAVTKAALPKHNVSESERVRKAESERADAIAKSMQLEARIAKMETVAVLKSHEDDVRSDCAVLGKDPVEQARVLKTLSDASKEGGEAYRNLLRDSARLAKTGGVFKSVGTSANAQFGGSIPTDANGTPQEQLQALLNGMVQKGDAADEKSAWNALMKTQRGQDLYNQMHGGNR